MNEMLVDKRRLTTAQFGAFYDQRPDGERWELIDGVPLMMMTPPTLMHQRISKNVERMLDERLQSVRPEWTADREIGIQNPGDDAWSPEPDVTVIDTAIDDTTVYAERFYFVAEVLSDSNRPERASPSDKPIPLAAKIAFYQRHEHCRGVLIVRQDKIEADLHVRDGEVWMLIELRDPTARIVIPAIGDIGHLGDLYRNTPLAPKAN